MAIKLKAKIESIVKARIVKTGEEFLDVTIHLFDNEDNFVEERKYGYPVETDKKEIRKEISKVVALLNAESESADEQKKVDAIDKKTVTLKEELEGEIIE